MEKFREKVVSGFVWEAVTRLIVQVVSWAATIWVARILVPDDYGIVAIYGIFGAVGIHIAGLGLGGALVNRKVLKDQHTSNIFWLGLLSALLVYVALFLLAPLFAGMFDIPELASVIKVAALFIVVSAFGIVPRALAMRKLLFKEVALMSMLSGGVLAAVTLTMALMGFGYWSLITSTLVSEAFLVASFYWLIPYLPSRPNRILTTVPYVRFGFRIALGGVFSSANERWPIFVCSTVLGQTATGYLEMARVLASLPKDKIGMTFAAIAFPAFARIQNDVERTRSVFLRLHGVLYVVTVPMFLGLAVVADDLVPFLIGDRWSPIVIPIQVICVANLVAIGSQMITRVLEGLGKPRVSLNYQLIQFVLLPASMFVGVQWGLLGLLIAWAAVFPAAHTYMVVELTKLIRSSFWGLMLTVWPACVSALAMVLAVLMVKQHMGSADIGVVWTLIGEVTTGVVVYLVFIWMLDRSRVKEMISLVRQ